MRRRRADTAKAPTYRLLAVRVLSLRSTEGRLVIGGAGGRSFRCALGRSGQRATKREGDGATPMGRFRLLAVLWRRDRSLPPGSQLPRRPIRAADGWCDAVGDRNYNRPVQHPYAASAEEMWRGDGLYDVVVVLAANVRPRVQGRGSAIFMHLAREQHAPTAGCIALSRRDMREALRAAGRRALIVVGPGHSAAGGRAGAKGGLATP